MQTVADLRQGSFMKIRLVIGLLLLVVFIRWFGCEPATDKGPVQFLTNRVWVDKAATHPRDMVLRFALLGQVKRKVGLVMASSQYRFGGDIVHYRLDADRLTLIIPQTNQRATFKARTWACKDAPKPFDLCLELTHGGRSTILYSERKSAFGSRAVDIPLLEAAMMDPNADEVAACEGCTEHTPEWFSKRVTVEAQQPAVNEAHRP